jgi:hypothetical protein
MLRVRGSLASCNRGIALAIAAVIITILDRSQIIRMKQFDDIGYLI